MNQEKMMKQLENEKNVAKIKRKMTKERKIQVTFTKVVHVLEQDITEILFFSLFLYISLIFKSDYCFSRYSLKRQKSIRLLFFTWSSNVASYWAHLPQCVLY